MLIGVLRSVLKCEFSGESSPNDDVCSADSRSSVQRVYQPKHLCPFQGAARNELKLQNKLPVKVLKAKNADSFTAFEAGLHQIHATLIPQRFPPNYGVLSNCRLGRQ